MEQKKHKRILIVDDNPSDLKLLALVLDDSHYHVVTCIAPYACSTLLESNAFDLVVIDQNMPGMNGFELLEEVKKLQPKTVVLMITNAPTPEFSERALKLGAFAYMGKPMLLNQILPTIEQALSAGSSAI